MLDHPNQGKVWGRDLFGTAPVMMEERLTEARTGQESVTSHESDLGVEAGLRIGSELNVS